MEEHSEPTTELCIVGNTIGKETQLHLMNGTGYLWSLNPLLASTFLPLLIKMPRTTTFCSFHCSMFCYRLVDMNNTNIIIYLVFTMPSTTLLTLISESLVSLKVLIQNQSTWWFTDQTLRSVLVQRILSLPSVIMNSWSCTTRPIKSPNKIPYFTS